jgi:hypothetical protein
MTTPDRATLVADQREELRLEDDEPITLAEACKLFPRAKLTVSTLRAEAGRGRLDIFASESVITPRCAQCRRWCADAKKKITAAALPR